MAGNVVADVAAMETAAKHVETVNDSLGTELVNVRNLVAGSQGNWEGAAAGSFRRIMDEYDGASRQIHDVLAEIAVLIRENGRGYDEAEQRNQDAILQAGASGDLGSSLKI